MAMFTTILDPKTLIHQLQDRERTNFSLERKDLKQDSRFYRIPGLFSRGLATRSKSSHDQN